MLEIKIHGRGGQGAVIAAKALAHAGALEDLFVQSFPEFGVERRGAPVCSYFRCSDSWVYERGRILTPDHIMVLDTTLIDEVDITKGLKPNGWLLINSQLSPKSFEEQFSGFNIATIKANAIAISHELGSKFAPFINFSMLGAFIRIVPLIRLETLQRVVRMLAPTQKEENVLAAVESYRSVSFHLVEEETWTKK